MKSDQEIEADAVAFIKTHQKDLIQKFAPPEICHPVEIPTSLFMAGSPGAGKTEVSKSLVKQFNDIPIRIDADEIRAECPGYNGTNAHLFQSAANKGVNILYDYARHKNLNCILDGTFAYAGAAENIQRSLDRKRKVEVWFVYQDPLKAWEFTKAREARETRHVSREIFIKTFFDSRRNACAVKERFGGEIKLNLLTKDYEKNEEDVHLNISAVELDRATDSRYSLEELIRILI